MKSVHPELDLTANIHEGNKHVENESFNEKEVETTIMLKKELTENGFILCEKETCQMGYLSIAGFINHQDKCTGSVKDGEFVVCPLCSVRFKSFTFVEQHIKKSHGDQEVAFNSIPQNPETSKVPTLSDDSYDCETKTETQVIENDVMQEKQSEEIDCDSS
jgi:uncharacterized C2H2 Zn-finger protein